MTTPPHISAIEPAAVRAYLINIADTLQRSVIPALEGKALTRANECVTMLARIAARVTAPAAASRESLGALAALGSFLADPARAVALDGAVLDAEEGEAIAVKDSVIAPAAAGQRRFDRDGLEAYLRRHPLGAPDLRITDALELQGGRSKLTVKVTQSGSAKLPASFIVRQDWASSVVGTSVVPEFEMLRRIHAAGILVPEPLLLESGSEATGAPFIVVACVAGKAEGDIFDPPPSEVLALDVARQLAKLHALGAAPFQGLPGVVVRGHGAGLLAAELAAMRAIIGALGERSATMEVALDWLDREIPKIEGPLALVHGDLGFHNLLVDRGRLSAVLDWELAHLGNPAEDLGYARPWVERMTAWDTFSAAYRAAGGASVAPRAVDFYSVWGSLRLYAMLLQARAAITSGMLRDCEITMCSVHFIPYILHRVSRDLRRAIRLV